MASHRNIALVLVICVGVGALDTVGSRHPEDTKKAESELRELDNEVETGKLYFTGTGYTVNLIPHAIVLGLLTFAVIFLYGDSLFGTDISAYGAPSYAAQRYYDPYAAGAASSLGAEVYSPELNPYNIAQEAAVAAEGRK